MLKISCRHTRRLKKVVPSKAQEKQIDREFEKSSGYSTYKVVQAAKKLEEGYFTLDK